MISTAFAYHLAATVPGLSFTPAGTTGNVFVGFEPTTPDIAVVVFDRPGVYRVDRRPGQEPGLQVIVRGAKRSTDDTLARAVYAALYLDHVTLAAGTPHQMRVEGSTPQQSAPTPLGRDLNDRHRWSIDTLLSTPTPIPA